MSRRILTVCVDIATDEENSVRLTLNPRWQGEEWKVCDSGNWVKQLTEKVTDGQGMVVVALCPESCGCQFHQDKEDIYVRVEWLFFSPGTAAENFSVPFW